jgi:glutaredoxin
MTTAVRLTLSILSLLALASPAQALYKVIGPDGKVTYTDRPPQGEAGRIAPIGGQVAPPEPAVTLPAELRQASTRYPVTLFASPSCPPCDNGRRMLRERGIPFAERLINSEEDAEAMQRLTGGRTVPSVTIGTQALRGWSETDWQAYLDAAGYPRESRLPRSYAAPAATPLVARQPEPAPAAPRAAPAASVAPLVEPPGPPASGIRF